MTYSENYFMGEIPVDWGTVFAKDVLQKIVRPVRSNDGVVTCFRDGQVILRSIRRPDGFTVALKEHGYQGVRVGDLVIHAMDAFAGAIGVSESDGKGSPVLSVCAVTPDSDSKYYSYLFRALAYSGYIESVGKGIRERSTDFRFSEVAKTIVLHPPLPEQQVIASYLDRHTSLIDRERDLIAKKIDLLRDKRQALIYEVVTGKRVVVEAQAVEGTVLDDVVFAGKWAAVPLDVARGCGLRRGRLVDSGVLWIGDIPEGWTVFRLSDIGEVKKTINHKMTETNRLALTMKGVIRRSLDDKAGLQASNYSGYQIFEKDDLVFKLIDLQNIKTSRVGLVPERGIMSPAYIRLALSDKCQAGFVYYVLYSAYLNNVFNDMGGGVRQTVGREELLRFAICAPDTSDQQHISAYLDHYFHLIDQELYLLNRKSELLADKRQALIFEAVTGKIDLRETDPFDS